jgi:cytochrome b subunit of formate dehydrogenase
MARKKSLTTDYGTVIAHSVIVACFIVAVLTGLRIATDDPEAAWLMQLDAVLPSEHLWYRHLASAVLMGAALGGYAVYVRQARLGARVRVDQARMAAIKRGGKGRWGALNVLVYWVLMAALATEISTGLLLFAGHGAPFIALHLQATFVCIASVVVHVALHAAYGGLAQLKRIVTPASLTMPPPPPDLANILAKVLAERETGDVQARPPLLEPQSEQSEGPRDRTVRVAQDDQPKVRHAARTTALNVNPFATGLAVAVVLCAAAVTGEQATRTTLSIGEITPSEAPQLDGDLSDAAWTTAQPVTVMTTQGGDFGGKHESLIEVRAVHDGENAYFAFVWDDPTRSLKHMPLIKRDGRWQVMATREDLADETEYYEDKFAVLLARGGLPLIGGAIHLASQPLDGKPGSDTGRGLHYTSDGGIVDVWQWRASHAGPSGYIENAHFGGPAIVTPGKNDQHYEGGFKLDPGSVPYESNIEPDAVNGGFKPKRLPRDPQSAMRAMGQLIDKSSVNAKPQPRYWMTAAESVPFSGKADAAIPDGTVVPGVLASEAVAGDRNAIRGAARWASGRWTLEVVRKLYTGSPVDVPLKSGVLMWVAAFDHADKRHTRHLRPLVLEVH